MQKGQVNVHIVDDDPAMRDAMNFMLQEAGLTTRMYASGEEFLDAAPCDGCLILDLRMPGIDGMEVHQQLRARGSPLPVIILTGHGEIDSAVCAMKRGAFDYLTKPVNREELLGAVRSALALAHAGATTQHELEKVRKMLQTLSHRERQVLHAVATGHSSKQIARNLCISARTIANHRAHFMRKMQASNIADLARKLSLLGPIGTEPQKVG
jgi:FixJ family two-component response regulator